MGIQDGNLSTRNGGAPDAAAEAGSNMLAEVHVLQSGENDWNLTKQALRQQLDKGGRQDVQVTDKMIVRHLQEFYRANSGRTDNRGHRLDNEPSWNNIADGTEIYIPKFDLRQYVPAQPPAPEITPAVTPPVTDTTPPPVEPPPVTPPVTGGTDTTPPVSEPVPEVVPEPPKKVEPDKAAAEPAKLKPTASGAYNPIAPPGLDFEPGDLTYWQFGNHKSADNSFEVRSRTGQTTDNLNGTKTHRYEGWFNDSYMPFDDNSFKAEETLDSSGKLLRRRIEYSDTSNLAYWLTQKPMFGRGINYDGIDFQGPGGTTHHVDNVKTIDTDFDAAIGRYRTAIRTRDGKEYRAISDAQGNVLQWQDPLET